MASKRRKRARSSFCLDGEDGKFVGVAHVDVRVGAQFPRQNAKASKVKQEQVLPQEGEQVSTTKPTDSRWRFATSRPGCLNSDLQAATAVIQVQLACKNI